MKWIQISKIVFALAFVVWACAILSSTCGLEAEDHQQLVDSLASSQITSATLEEINDVGSTLSTTVIAPSDFKELQEIIVNAQTPYRGGRTYTRDLFRLRIVLESKEKLTLLVRVLSTEPENVYVSVNNIFPIAEGQSRSIPVTRRGAPGRAEWFRSRKGKRSSTHVKKGPTVLSLSQEESRPESPYEKSDLEPLDNTAANKRSELTVDPLRVPTDTQP